MSTVDLTTFVGTIGGLITAGGALYATVRKGRGDSETNSQTVAKLIKEDNDGLRQSIKDLKTDYEAQISILKANHDKQLEAVRAENSDLQLQIDRLYKLLYNRDDPKIRP